jgi:hypothetical protein
LPDLRPPPPAAVNEQCLTKWCLSVSPPNGKPLKSESQTNPERHTLARRGVPISGNWDAGKQQRSEVRSQSYRIPAPRPPRRQSRTHNLRPTENPLPPCDSHFSELCAGNWPPPGVNSRIRERMATPQVAVARSYGTKPDLAEVVRLFALRASGSVQFPFGSADLPVP